MKKPECPKCGRTMWNGGTTPGGKIRWECRVGSVFCYSTTNPIAARTRSGKISSLPPVFKRKTTGSSRFIVTAAQNATPVHKEFLRSLLVACKHLGAELLVIPLRYKNPTSHFTASQSNDETWDPAVQPYLCNERKRLAKGLIMLGDIKTQPTSSSPLTGFEAISHGESAIIGHTKLQLRCIPTPQNRMPKILTTTGAVTIPNYTDSKAGKVGEFHHTLGATMVEVGGGKFHLRQLNADKKTGEFYDLTNLFGPNGVKTKQRIAALVMGDTHVDFIDPAVERATFGKGGILDTLLPKTLVWHDLLDGYSVNPHHFGNPFISIAKARNNAQDVRAEVLRALDFVREKTPKGVGSVIVASNHDDMLRRWIISSDWKLDPVNAEFYLQTALAMVAGIKFDGHGTSTPSPFPYWARKLLPEAKVLGGDESCEIAGIEVGMHGDRGPSGSRGSIKNLRRIGVKSIIGHTHSPGIDEGCYQVGTSTALKLEYTCGPSGWLNTHAVIYPNGKRTLLNLIGGDYKI